MLVALSETRLCQGFSQERAGEENRTMNAPHCSFSAVGSAAIESRIWIRVL